MSRRPEVRDRLVKYLDLHELPYSLMADGGLEIHNYAPPHLLDLAAGTEARLEMPASYNGRMCLKNDLSTYHDLWTVVESLGRIHSMEIHPRESGGFQVYISDH